MFYLQYDKAIIKQASVRISDADYNCKVSDFMIDYRLFLKTLFRFKEFLRYFSFSCSIFFLKAYPKKHNKTMRQGLDHLLQI